MKVKIIGVGKVKKSLFSDGINEYSKRLQSFTDFEIVEVKDEKAPENLSESEILKVKEKEGERILSKIKDDDYVFALAIEGKEYSSEQFAKKIEELTTYGHSKIDFVIGGSLGLSKQVMDRSNQSVSFGRFTLPHQLMRLVLAEQIYRSFMINAGNPYHK